MNTVTLNDFSEYVVAVEDYPGVKQRMVLKFGNGYGVSVLHEDLYEKPFGVAVLKFEDGRDDKWVVCYDTHLTDDTIKANSDELAPLFNQVMAL